jgi:hypothetical protein
MRATAVRRGEKAFVELVLSQAGGLAGPQPVSPDDRHAVFILGSLAGSGRGQSIKCEPKVSAVAFSLGVRT